MLALAGPAKYHLFDLGAELHSRGLLAGLLTGYPKGRLGGLGVPSEKIVSLPHFHVLYRVLTRLGWKLEYRDRVAFDLLASRSLPPADVYHLIAGSALRTIRAAHKAGRKVVVDRPCSHIVVQDRLLRGEFEFSGVPFRGIDPRVVAQERQEYEEADVITVPSEFAKRSFLEMGFAPERVRVVPYGVSLERFQPLGGRDPEAFVAMFAGFASVRKSVPRLLKAFETVRHPRKRLVLVGEIGRDVRRHIEAARPLGWLDVRGHVPQTSLKGLMSQASVLVLPSIEDGYGVVMSQAMACGTCVLASQNTGAEMLITPEQDGLIVPAGDTEALAAGLQRLADDPALVARLGEGALQRARSLGGWSSYCDGVVAMARELLP
jgi:glycosyltransferase involved in cell wall biosynthesis